MGGLLYFRFPGTTEFLQAGLPTWVNWVILTAIALNLAYVVLLLYSISATEVSVTSLGLKVTGPGLSVEISLAETVEVVLEGRAIIWRGRVRPTLGSDTSRVWLPAPLTVGEGELRLSDLRDPERMLDPLTGLLPATRLLRR
ncbi:MAG: hypothetical protein JKY65_21395 [Planctomycetes bacterium]|nr:hypothetical protein [Planctomycetota bacterium]